MLHGTHSSMHKVGDKNPLYGKHLSDEHKNKIRAATKGRIVLEKTKIKLRGENSSSSILKEKDVIYIRKSFNSGKCTKKELVKKYGVSRGCIDGVVNNKKWKYLL